MPINVQAKFERQLDDMANRLGVICVHYDSNKVIPTLRSLDRITNAARAKRTVFVANQDSARIALAQHAASREASVVIQHDNSGMEFGAYQAGLDRLLAEFEPEWVLFANDTFSTHHSFGAVYCEKLVGDLARDFAHPALVGQVVSLPRSYEIEGLRTHRWMTTNLFALNRAAIRALNARVYRPDLDSLVTATSEMSAFFSSRVDAVLREHLEAWLFRAHAGWHWYASEPLQPANARRMARKARSILQEKYLAALLEDRSAAFVDLNDLSFSKKLLREFDRRMFSLKAR